MQTFAQTLTQLIFIPQSNLSQVPGSPHPGWVKVPLRLPQLLPRLLAPYRLRLLGQASDGQVINHLLDFLHVVLQTIVSLSQRVILEVE